MDELFNKVRNAILETRGESLSEEREIPLSHRHKHDVSHYRVLNNGRDVTRHDTYEDAKAYAAKHRAKLKKDGYRSNQVTVHAYIKEDVNLDESYSELMRLKDNIARNEKKMKSIQGIHPEKKRLAIQIEKDIKRHKELFNKYWGKNEETELGEKTNPYAIGMAAAEKSTGDRPPLKKSTIIKAHRIAKKIEAKEEVEELDELSRKTLGSYAKKAMDQATAAQGYQAVAAQTGDREGYKREMKHKWKRQAGAKKAIDKLTKEESELGEAGLVIPRKDNLVSLKQHSFGGSNGSQSHGAGEDEPGAHRKPSRDKIKEEVEELDELSTNTLDSYRSKARTQIINTRNKDTDTTEKRLKGYTKASQKITKNFVKGVDEEVEQVAEARGRPPKEGSEAWKRAQEERKKDPAEHIINRMGQASTNMTGGQHVTYDNGKTHRVSNHLAARTLEHYRGLKPAQKFDFQKRIAKSHEDHLDALQGK